MMVRKTWTEVVAFLSNFECVLEDKTVDSGNPRWRSKKKKALPVTLAERKSSEGQEPGEPSHEEGQ